MIVGGIVLKNRLMSAADGANMSVNEPRYIAPSVIVSDITDVGGTIPGIPLASETATWGERWRYDDPFHALGMVPMAGMAYRVAVIGGSYLLDLFTAEQQGITPISFEGDPGWSQSIL